ncbi:MAG: transglutaminase family protein, partial [Myxococcota bacterium]
IPRRVEGALHRIERDANGGLYASAEIDERIRYTLWSQAQTWDDETLALDRAATPRERRRSVGASATRYLELPEFDPAVAELAEAITSAGRTDAERLRGIERYLRREGRYTDAPPDLSDLSDGSPIEQFLLGELAGHCEYFASAMIVLARSAGYSARLVNGFAGGRVNRIGGFVELARSDAHAWVEVHFEQAGWVRYDPTPPDLRLRAEYAQGLAERIGELSSVLELWWFQRVVDFDSSDQIRALKSAWEMWRSVRSAAAGSPGDSKGGFAPDWRPGADLPWRDLLLVGAGLGLLGWWLRPGRQARRASATPASYRRALRMLARRGHQREATTTARAFAARVSESLPAPAGAAFAALTECYLEERFAARSVAGSAEKLRALRSSLPFAMAGFIARPPACASGESSERR